MIRELGRFAGRRAGRHAGRWAGGIVAGLLLMIAGPAVARQAAANPTTTSPTAGRAMMAAAPAVQTYAECTRVYASRRDVASYCRRLFPQTPAVTSYPTCVEAIGRTAEAQKLCAQRYPDGAPKPAEPVDITPQLNQLIDSWVNRPKPSPKPTTPPADPLAVVPGIQAACAPWAGNAERWLRCTADGWRDAGLRGQPPLVLQTPPTAPPVTPPPVRPEPTDQTSVKPPPVKPEPPFIPKPAPPEPAVLIQPDLPVDIAPTPIKPEAPPKPAPQPPQPPRPDPPSIPIWAWLLALVVALVAAGVGVFGLSRWLARARPSPAAPQSVAAAPTAPPQIALVADPGVVVLTPEGPPRAGLAVSVRVAPAEAGDNDVRLDYPSLETAP